MDETLALATVQYKNNEYGVAVKTLSLREIFCKVKEISRSEFYQAKQQNLQAEYMFEIFYADYEHETLLKYDDTIYTIYRTFRRGDRLEIYAQRRLGDEFN